MEELLNQLANILNISTDRLLDMYPMLREQYINTYALRTLYEYAEIILIGLFLVGSIVMLFAETSFMSEEELSKFRKFIVLYVCITLITIIFSILLKHRIIKLAPDLMMLKELM